jgi:hypothetical protein
MRTIRIVNVIPNDHSNETNDDAEPSVTVNPNNIDELVVTAFTPTEGGNPNGPLFVSADGGENWIISFDIPGGETHDQSPLWGGTSDQLFMGTLRGGTGGGDEGDLNVLRTADPSVGTADLIKSRSPVDQPWVEATAVHGGSDDGKVRLYVGYNRFNIAKSATVDVCLDARGSSPSFNRVQLDPRNPSPNDGYEIRPTVHSDGTVYVAYKSRSSFVGQMSVADIVVARDDNWGSGSSPFQDLKDPDGKAGRLVATNVPINEVNDIGGVRLNNDLNIAVDPSNSSTVYIVWCDDAGPNYTLRVRRSTNRGEDWSDDLLTAENAALATMTINLRGMVGLMYQQLVGGRIETHFRTTVNGTSWDDTILARTDPSPDFTGDYARLVAVGLDFYGVFPAMNSPAPANFFPNGGGTMKYLRNTSGANLIGTDGTTVVAQSVDPFFFRVQQRDCTIITDRNTFGKDEVDAILHGTNPAIIDAAFYVTVDGFRASDLNITAGTLSGTPNVAPHITFGPALSGMTAQAVKCDAEDSDDLQVPQRFTWTYQAVFTSSNDFTSESVPVVMTASITSTAGLTVSGEALITLTTQPNPYEVDGPTSWLSVDVQVFTLVAGGSLPSTPNIKLGSDPHDFIARLLSNTNGGYNDPSLPRAPNHPYDHDLVAHQDTSTVSLAGTIFFFPIFNFAVARVRYRALSTSAPNVRVFFRMFQMSTTSTEFQPTTTYLTGGQGGTKIPLLGVVNNEIVTIPFFAAPRVDPTNPAGLNAQTDPVNVGPNGQAIPPDGSGAEVQVYFGCWLDINQTAHVMPADGVNGSAPFVPARSIQELIRGQHQCLVAEINLDTPAPQIATGIAPANSDKLAQRNLTIVGVASPHQVPVTFDIKPTAQAAAPTETPDELLIDWGGVPPGTKASIFLPGTSADAILETANRLYLAHGLSREDAHTINCQARGLTFMPIPPGIGSNYAGLLTLDLPPAVPRDRVFKVVARQLRTIRAKRPAPIPILEIALHAAATSQTDLIEWRRVVGTFQLNIPVSTRELLLPIEERLLSVLRWIASRMAVTDRFYPVFQRYLQQVGGRVTDLGGDPSTIKPSPSGEPERPKPRDARCVTGKVVGIMFDHFGDFEGFTLDDGDREHRFLSREQHVEQLVERAWRERLRITVCAARQSPHLVATIIVLEPPALFGP